MLIPWKLSDQKQSILAFGDVIFSDYFVYVFLIKTLNLLFIFLFVQEFCA